MFHRVQSKATLRFFAALRPFHALRASALFVTLGLFSLSALAAPPTDRKAPSTPGSLRGTAATPYSVALSWNASSDASAFTYRVRHSWGYEETLPMGQTSFTWSSQLEAGRSYSFFVYAVDVAGNRSRNSNTVNITLPRDLTPPSAPEVVVTEVGPTHVSLAWSATDDSPNLWYTVFQNGIPIYPLIGTEAATAYLLLPNSTYTFRVRARDFGGNLSPLSTPVVVTTPGIGATDLLPPSVVTNLVSDVFDNEIDLRWTAASDNRDPPDLLSYEVSLNGELVDVAVGGRTHSIVYGVNGLNLVSLVTRDTSGNASSAVTLLVAVEF